MSLGGTAVSWSRPTLSAAPLLMESAQGPGWPPHAINPSLPVLHKQLANTYCECPRSLP